MRCLQYEFDNSSTFLLGLRAEPCGSDQNVWQTLHRQSLSREPGHACRGEDWRGERYSQETCRGVQQEKDGAIAAKSGQFFSWHKKISNFN